MPDMPTNQSLQKILLVLFSLLLGGSFFLSWVSWEQSLVSGKDFATGHFFEASESGYGLTNPFPEYAFANAAFWLVPVLAVITVILVITKKSFGLVPALAGSLALALATIFYLFTSGELHLPVPASLKAGFYISVIAAAGVIFLAWKRSALWKLLFIAAPLLITYFGYEKVKSAVMNEKVADTASLPADYSADALAFISEFVAGDSAANAKYREKTIELSGIATEVNATDTTATLSFADSTGSYVIFDFARDQVAAVKALQPGQAATVKGICSGGIYSDILGTETISFKYAVLVNNKK